MSLKILILLYIMILSSLFVLTGSASYGLNYYLGGRGVPTDQNGIHGSHSALLSYDNKTRYIKIDLEEPLAFDELDQLTMQIMPLTENGKLGIDLYFDGDGDGKWSSKSERDVKLYARIDSWNNYHDWIEGEWNELNAFKLDYKRSGYGSDNMTLPEWNEDLPSDLYLVRVYLRIYKPGNGECLVDYFNINGMVLSFEPFESSELKVGKPKTISRGGKITYTITYGNDLNETITNMVIVEQYDPRMEIVSVDPPPDPGTNNVWTIGSLPNGTYGRIVIVMKMRKQNFKADIEGQVEGSGYVSVRRRFSTERSPQVITNKVMLSCDQFNKTAEVRTGVRPIPETSITFVEHGSGNYSSSEVLTYRSYKIVMERVFNATKSSSVIQLSRGRPLVYNSSWHADHICENQKRRSLIGESYLYSDRLNCANNAEVRSTRMKMDSESNFTGLGVYVIGSDMNGRYAALADIFKGNFSVKSSREIYR